MSIAYEMSAAERIHFPDPQEPQEPQPFIVNGVELDPLDVMLSVLQIVPAEELEETGFSDIITFPVSEQMIAYHGFLAAAKGVTQEEIDQLSPDLTPEKRVQAMLELIEFSKGHDARRRFDEKPEKPAPPSTEFFQAQIHPAKSDDIESVSGFRKKTRTELIERGFPEDVVDWVEVQVSETVTNVKQLYPHGGGRIWVGRTARDILVVAEGEPSPPNVITLHKKPSAEIIAALGDRDVAERGRGDNVMAGENGTSGKFTIARDKDGKSIAYQTWCTTPLPEEFHQTDPS